MAAILVTAFGYLGVHQRARRDESLLRLQIETHLALSQRQFETHIEVTRSNHRQQKLEDSYDQLAVWLHQLERCIDEVWFGCSGQDEDAERRAHQLIHEWPSETLRVPLEISWAQFYWGEDVRKAIRHFQGDSHRFMLAADIALVQKHKDGQSPEDLSGNASQVWEQRSALLDHITEIRNRVRVELAIDGE